MPFQQPGFLSGRGTACFYVEHDYQRLGLLFCLVIDNVGV